jgi:hypothetical protein
MQRDFVIPASDGLLKHVERLKESYYERFSYDFRSVVEGTLRSGDSKTAVSFLCARGLVDSPVSTTDSTLLGHGMGLLMVPVWFKYERGGCRD